MPFDQIASSYDRWHETTLGRFVDQVETELIFNLFKVKKGTLLLDAGCGTGNFSLKLAHKGAQVVGVDVSPEMLSIARDKADGENLKIVFREMNICNLSFPEGYFDGIISIATFEFIQAPRRAFNELIRVLKRGGYLLVGTINKNSSWGSLYEKQARLPGSIYRHARFKTWNDLRDLDQQNLVNTGECLFIKPDTVQENINMDEESRLSNTENGGFIAALWQKP